MPFPEVLKDASEPLLWIADTAFTDDRFAGNPMVLVPSLPVAAKCITPALLVDAKALEIADDPLPPPQEELVTRAPELAAQLMPETVQESCDSRNGRQKKMR